jgi:hypothetical protein
MSFEIETIPEKKLIKVSKSGDLSAGKNIKILVDGEVFQELDYTVPTGKVAHIRIDIRGSISNE